MKSPTRQPSIKFSAVSLPTAICAILLVSGCSKKSEPALAAKASPAKVEMVPHETELATLKLTGEAVKRLAIEVVPVEKMRQLYGTMNGVVKCEIILICECFLKMIDYVCLIA